MNRIFLMSVAAVGLCLMTARPTLAATNFTLQQIDGSDLQVKVSIQELAGALSSVKVTLDVVNPPYYADLRGVFMNISNVSLLTDLLVTGATATDTSYMGTPVISANNVNDLGHGANINGQVFNTYGDFDFGVEIGTQGIGKDDISHFAFILSNPNHDITESLFTGLPMAIRATSVGDSSDSREGSSKLAGFIPDQPSHSVPTPEPATAVMGILALAALAASTRRRHLRR